MEKKTYNSSDRLVSLPEILIHHIFDLASVDMRQAVQFSVLSTNWRYFWRSLPSVNITINTLSEKNFVNNVLTLHSAAYIHTLSLKTNFARIEVQFVDKLIVFLLTKHVQEVHIEGKAISMFKSSLDLFLNQSKHVKTLKLMYVYIVDEAKQELVLRSSTLENLVLWCHHKSDSVIIDCPRLKYLDIHNGDAYGTGMTREIKIHAPNLLRIHFQGDLFREYFMEESSCIVDAHVDILPSDRELFSKYLDNLLGVLGKAKSLTLNAHVFQEYGELLFSRDVVHGEFQFMSDRVSFPNLKYLKVVDWSTKNHIQALVKFIERFSSIESFILERDKGQETDSSEDDGIGEYRGRNWDTQLAFTSNYNELQSFEIQITEADDNELIFIEYIMRSAPELKNITLTMQKAPSNAKSKLLEFVKKVHLLHGYSSKVIVSLEENNLTLRDVESDNYKDCEMDTTGKEENTENITLGLKGCRVKARLICLVSSAVRRFYATGFLALVLILMLIYFFLLL